MDKVRLIGSSRIGKEKVITIWTQGSVLYHQWGYIDGKMQESKKFVDGKEHTTAVEQAELEAQRIINKKLEEGYHMEGASNDDTLFSFNPLPTSFAPSKPFTEKPRDVDTNLWSYCAERKNNGVNILRVCDMSGVNHTYTRGIKDITSIVSRINPIQSFNTILLPPGTIVSYEFIVYNDEGIETPKDLRGIVSDKTTSEKARARYDLLIAEGYTFAIKVFDILFYGGEDQTNKEYYARRTLLQKTIWAYHDNYRSEFFFKLTPDAIKRAKERGWEGFILRKMTGPESTVEYTLNGKPYRKGAWKYVFEKRSDFHVIEVQIGDAGRLTGLPARFHLVQYNAKGEVIDCQWAGPGKLTTDELVSLSKDLGLESYKPRSIYNIEKSNLTAEVVFRDYQITNALQFPVIHRIRDDKPAKECLYGE
jgi:ATP-dependent DNA ligase